MAALEQIAQCWNMRAIFDNALLDNGFIELGRRFHRGGRTCHASCFLTRPLAKLPFLSFLAPCPRKAVWRAPLQSCIRVPYD